jgi:gamma-glutamyltranspeptidase
MRKLALACPHTAACEAGRECFEQGGNAVDAALGACAVLAVVYPHMCTVGGDLFALTHAPDGDIVSYNGSGCAPTALDGDAVRLAHEEMPLVGPETITVPGVPAAWGALAEEGRLGLRAVTQAAIRYASDGCAVAPSLARALVRDEALVTADPGLAAVFSPSGAVLREGEVFRQPQLAATLSALAEAGPQALYEGSLGAAYVRGLNEVGSLMAREDLASHVTTCSAPFQGECEGWRVVTSPPNSQGYTLSLIVALLKELSLPLEALGRAAGQLARVFARAARDRDETLSDPRRMRVPVDQLLAPARVSALAREVSSSLPTSTTLDAADERSTGRSGDTVAVVAADSEGWGVSIIQSIFHSFGSGLLEPSTGILSHNRGACFSLDPRSANFLRGGFRPAHTLMPVMVTKHGRLEVVAGTMGGRAQPQIHAQLLGRVFAGDASLAEIIARPRWVVGSLDAGGSEEAVFAEPGAVDECGEWLAASGMRVEVVGEDSDEVGHAQYIRIADSSLEAASDPRADGTAVVSSAS